MVVSRKRSCRSSRARFFLYFATCFPLASQRSRPRSLGCMISGKRVTLMARLKTCQEATTSGGVLIWLLCEPLCSLCLCGCCIVHSYNHRDTEDTKVAQRRVQIRPLPCFARFCEKTKYEVPSTKHKMIF